MSGYAAAQAPAQMDTAQQQQQQPLNFVPAQQQPDAATSAAGPSTDAGLAAAAASAGDDEDYDDMDIDPRTLQQAAARLAHFTSDEALGERLGADTAVGHRSAAGVSCCITR
jgi:hypothetical protein